MNNILIIISSIFITIGFIFSAIALMAIAALLPGKAMTTGVCFCTDFLKKSSKGTAPSKCKLTSK
jgi:hypothetical protein